jgi:hypothetical protein
VLGTFELMVVWQRLSTGLLGVALGRQPEGIVPEVSSELDEKRRKKVHDAARAGPGPGPADDATAETSRPAPVPTAGS